MATPGRTHIAWQSDSQHIRELISYIAFLEAKVSYLQRHHEHCDIWRPGAHVLGPDVLYLPPDAIPAWQGTDDFPDDDRLVPEVKPVPSTTSLTPIQTQEPPVKSFKGNPRWKQIIDQMSKGWEQPNSWLEKRESIGLRTREQNQYTLTSILGAKDDAIFSDASSDNPSPNNSTDDLVTLSQQYAFDCKAAGKSTMLDARVSIFRELVFTSLCVVLEHQAVPIDTIDNLMRICISSSGAANLYRLRRGALWVNRVISGTMIKKLGWGHCATEFFFICKSFWYWVQQPDY